MFERYNINDLFLASISVMYPDNNIICDINIGGILMIGTAGYGYFTILRKQDDKYFDLQDQSKKITTIRDPETTSYTIDYIEPLSKHYTQEGKKRYTVSKRKAIREANKYYDVMHQEHLAQLQEQHTKVYKSDV